jgi:excisionase family DNA binding protein
MNNAFLLTLEEAGVRLSVSARTVRRLIEAGELAPVRIGRSLRVSADSIRAYVDRSIPVSHNPGRVGPDVQETSTCRENASRTKTASIVAQIRPSGGRPTSTQAAKELDALLARPSDRKLKRSLRSGDSKHTAKSSGASSPSTPSMN